MSRKLNCHCNGHADCNLCHGSGQYDYQPSELGWMPFPCPTCESKGVVRSVDGVESPCKTCRGQGMVDPGDAPTKGGWNRMWKILMGA